MIFILGILSGGYYFYGRLISRVVGIDPRRKTPAYEKHDGVDFVPAKHWFVLFGHHFSSICGAGPVVGPVIAVAYWGWGASLIWILLGSILLGAVSDFTSLVVSVRHEGQSIPEIARQVISPRARLLFSIFIWLSLILVITVFSILAAKTYTAQPEIVLPSLGIIPLAIVVGYAMYVRKMGFGRVSILGLMGLILIIYFGDKFPVNLGFTSWILILLVYAYIASVVPVQYLLQPRDYLSGYILFAAILVGVLGVFISHKPMLDPAFLGFVPDKTLWPSAGPLWPMLFVTIACGAISGFHSLVSSGTTCKQLETEAHACRVGYGGMLTEALVACLVVLCVTAGLDRVELLGLLSDPTKGGPIEAFGRGFGNLTLPLIGSYGAVFAVMALNAFILTTLDTATRIGRYLTSELFGINNRYLATGIVVGISAALALTGQWQKIWPVFGASNQLVAALSLLVVSCWLMGLKRPSWSTLIPSIFMVLTTIAAFVIQIYAALVREEPQLTIALSASILVVLALMVFFEGWKTLKTQFELS